MTVHRRWLPSFALAALLAACGGTTSEPVGGAGTEAAAELPPEPDRPSGVLEGRVLLAPGVELPAWEQHPLAVSRSPISDACTPPQEGDRYPLQLSAGRALGGVLVALSNFRSEVPHEPVTHEVTITDCRITPRFVDATRGDSIRVTNRTDFPFLPVFGAAGGMMQALLYEQSRDIELDRGGVWPLNCGFGAPCGRADVVVLYHPVHTLTDDEGRFRIENPPSGENLRLSAWHPLLREAAVEITVRAGQDQTVEDLVVTIAPAPEAGEPAPPPLVNDPDSEL